MLKWLFNDAADDSFLFLAEEEEGEGSDDRGKVKGRALTKFMDKMEKAAQLLKNGEYERAVEHILKIFELNPNLPDSRRDKCCDMLLKVMDRVELAQDWGMLEELKRKLARRGIVYTPANNRHPKPLMKPAPALPSPKTPKWKGRF